MQLPKTATQEFYVHLSNYPDLGNPFELWCHDMSEHGRACLGRVTITFDVPQDINPVEAQIACIQKEIEKADKEHMGKVLLLQRRIKELQAITHQI